MITQYSNWCPYNPTYMYVSACFCISCTYYKCVNWCMNIIRAWSWMKQGHTRAVWVCQEITQSERSLQSTNLQANEISTTKLMNQTLHDKYLLLRYDICYDSTTVRRSLYFISLHQDKGRGNTTFHLWCHSLLKNWVIIITTGILW